MKKIIVLMIVGVFVGVGGWWIYSNMQVLAPNSAGPLEAVTLKLNWRHEAEFAGNYVAIEKGFYRENDLDVKIEEYSPDGQSAIDTVLSGKADFGIAGADEVLKARLDGKNIKSVAVIFKTNPAVAFALKSSGITSPKDFVGKTIGLERGINVDSLYFAMMSKLGIDRKKIKEVDIGYDAKELMDGKVDISTGWITNEPQLVLTAGYPVNTFLMADYGVNMYADTIVTSDKMIEENPRLVEKFVRGTLQGWQYTIEQEPEAVDITMKYARDTTRTHQAHVLAASIPLINTGTSRLGVMETSRWIQAQDILFDQKIIIKKVSVADVFTNKFLESIYK